LIVACEFDSKLLFVTRLWQDPSRLMSVYGGCENRGVRRESRAICRIRGDVTVGVFRQIDSGRLKQVMMTMKSRVNDGKK
jgi:hypothetical protein